MTYRRLRMIQNHIRGVETITGEKNKSLTDKERLIIKAMIYIGVKSYPAIRAVKKFNKMKFKDRLFEQTLKNRDWSCGYNHDAKFKKIFVWRISTRKWFKLDWQRRAKIIK